MGTLTILLLVGALNGFLLASLIATSAGNRAANRFLALLVGLVSLRVGIYILGFAGAYDDHPWLTFLPLDLSFSYGPLLWLYVDTLTHGRPPPRWALHLLPAAAQFFYYLGCFLLPMPSKWLWYAGPHLQLVEPVFLALVLLSAAGYLLRAWRVFRAYQGWLDGHLGNRERYRLGWLRLMLGSFAALVAAAIGFTLWSRFVGPLDYFGRVPVIAGFCVLTYALGLLGWRHGAESYPCPVAADPGQAEPADAKVDYGPLAARWRARIEREGWWRDEGLDLADLASRLAVSERTLSRVLNRGGGRTFNSFINELRVEAMQRAMRAGEGKGDLLALAFECGFASKASFNRAFRAQCGQSPSQWRAANAATSQFPPIAALSGK